MMSFLWTRAGNKPRPKRSSRTLKKQVCNPANSSLDKPLDHTCFTRKALVNLKKTYNQNHPNNKITSNEPAEIWKRLSEKIPQCDRESCWLNQIHDKQMRDKMQKELFAPFQPSAWKHNPNKWLSNFDILDVLAQYEQKHKEFKFIGPTPIDFDSRSEEPGEMCVWKDLCTLDLETEWKNGIRKIGIIFNLDPHDKGGSHWVSLFIDLTNDYGHPFLFYFDSTSAPPPKEIRSLVNRLKKQGTAMHPPIKFIYHTNRLTQHQKGDTECGVYSLFFIITLLTKQIDNKNLSNSQLIKTFKGSTRIPDEYIQKYRKIYFNT